MPYDYDIEAPYRIVSRIYEGKKTYPAVVHVFYGQTLLEASKYHQAHLRTDAFLRACTIDKKFSDFTCREQHVSQHWNGTGWVQAF